MSRRPPNSDKAGRLAGDMYLWRDVAATVTPLAEPFTLPAAPGPAAAKTPPPAPRRAFPPPPPPPLPPLPAAATARPPLVPPALTGLDRRTTRKLVRGNVEIEARIDLHGLNVEMARVRLEQFIRDARHNRCRLILVITGKGASPYARHTLHSRDVHHAPERQGRLRRLLPRWLHEPGLRQHVAGFQPAHPKHGGGGAFYVRLRRNREHPGR